MGFSINCIEISLPDKKNILKESSHLYKNLYTEKDLGKSKRFFLNDYYQHLETEELKKNETNLDSDLFFDKNINIQLIVGKNGSGKSTLMDLMYGAINNFAYMFERGKKRPGAEKLYYIINLYVNIYFSISNSNKHDGEYVLICKNETVQLKKDSEIIKDFSLNANPETDSKNDNDIIQLVESFFYTIVTNYSMQSFIYSNYSGKTKEYDFKSRETIDSKTRHYWINSIFHKNDGYTTPIVLNPYRDDGFINCKNELELSKDRLATLFIYSKQENKKLFDPYSFYNMTFRPKENCLTKKYNLIYSRFNTKNPDHKAEKDDDVLYLLDDKIINILKQQFNFSNSGSYLKKNGICYLILKIIDITLKYSNYVKYAGVIYFNITELIIIDDKLFDELLNKIKKDNTHITKKIRRVVNFLRLDDSKFNNEHTFSWNDYTAEISKFYEKSSLSEGNKNLTNKNPFMDGKVDSFKSPLDIDNYLPPPIFDYKLILEKESKKEHINYNSLSSGELQLLQTLSVHAYHIENVLSVHGNDRSKYRCLNLVFDEIEMCFHPEYQRQFVQRLINMLTTISHNQASNKDEIFFNIIIITHSPFILSDVPKEKILFMENGTQVSKKLNTFAGNIGEMMYESFFLESTIGEFAENKIKKLIKEKKDENNIREMIGDIVIKSLLKESLN